MPEQPFIAMKKTLITLLALAGVAFATPSGWICDPDATVKDKNVLVSGTAVHTWDVSGTAGLTWTGGNAFSIAITLDVNSLAKIGTGEFDTTKRYAVMSIKDSDYNGLACVAIQNGEVQFINWNGADENVTHVASVSLSELGAQSSLTLVVNRDASDDMTMGVYADGNFDSGRTPLTGLSNRVFKDKNFTQLNFGGTTADSYLGDVNNVMPANANAAQFTLLGAAYMTGGVATTADLKTYYLLPEPSTACLSLLALAGLAARRRRR